MGDVIGTVKEVPEGIEWRIESFLSLRDGLYKSPSLFDAATLKLRDCKMEIAIRRDGIVVSRDIELYLLGTTGGLPNHLEWSFSVKTRDGNKYRETQGTEVFGCIYDHVYSGVIRLETHRLTEWLPYGMLTVLCTYKQIGKNKILRDFKQLYLSQEDCDVIIRVKEREFKAHKNILIARSPVLASTLRSDMKEKATGVVDIQDLDPSAFSDFLCFLYCAELDNLSDENVFGLFTAADKYDVKDLRTKCVEYMKANLSVDTFCDVIRLALLHSETELIQLSTNFFIKNASEIISTVKWKMFVAENPEHGHKLLVKFINRNQGWFFEVKKWFLCYIFIH